LPFGYCNGAFPVDGPGQFLVGRQFDGNPGLRVPGFRAERWQSHPQPHMLI